MIAVLIAGAVGMLVSLAATRLLISFFERLGKGQPILGAEDHGPVHQMAKQGTPTMGGIAILTAGFFGWIAAHLRGGLPFSDQAAVIWLTVFVLAGIGFLDDYLKLRKGSSDGVSGRAKLLMQTLAATITVLSVSYMLPEPLATSYALPFFKDLLIQLGLPMFLFMGVFVMVGASNAVNLTDGLDGLAIVPTLIAAASFGFIAYLAGNAIFSNYLQIHYVPGSGELAVFCAALIGAGLGFLWFNAPPAMVFMGDTGSLALGGALGAISIMTKHEIVLAIIGGLFVLEAVSVIVQVASFKLTGKRVFRMAPLHHHFELRGWAESTIVIRFWIISVVLALIGLATLKLR